MFSAVGLSEAIICALLVVSDRKHSCQLMNATKVFKHLDWEKVYSLNRCTVSHLPTWKHNNVAAKSCQVIWIFYHFIHLCSILSRIGLLHWGIYDSGLVSRCWKRAVGSASIVLLACAATTREGAVQEMCWSRNGKSNGGRTRTMWGG